MVRRTLAVCGAALLLGLLHGPAGGQTSLGGQRVGTASGSFLKIGLDARGTALGGAYTALAEGPFASFYNPAGIAKSNRVEAAFGYARWPADIGLVAAAFTRPLGNEGANLGIFFEYLGTTLEETTEYHPQGTGRSFVYNDALIGLCAARPFSDRLSIGGSFKLYREDLGSSVGGPVASGWLVDAGTVYQIGALDGRLAISLLHFGPDIRPEGDFPSHLTGGAVNYTAFSPPTSFRLGLSLRPYRRGPHALTTATEVAHVSDNQETFRAGVEYAFAGRYLARAGYDGGADAARLSAGLGVKLPFRGSDLRVDYAYTDGGPLLAIHRWSVLLPL